MVRRYRSFDLPAPPQREPINASFQPFPRPLEQPQPAFLELFDQLEPVSFADVWQTRMPGQTYDQQVIAAHDGPGQFLTAAQCNTCHNATPQSPLMPKMTVVTDQPGRNSRVRNLSVYGEWHVSPMGLAGRDPVFFSQLQSETNHLPQLTECVEMLCLHCHGVMGQRQLAIDTPDQANPACKDHFAVEPPPEVPFGKPLRRKVLQQWPGGTETDEQFYAALARDGVSRTVCLHVADQHLGQEATFTGNFVTGPPDEIYGPYEDDTIVTKPMEHALGMTPKLGLHIGSSDLCGSCHKVLLPIFDNAGRRIGAGYEQATYLEWLNSDSGRTGGPAFQTCQDCHMPTGIGPHQRARLHRRRHQRPRPGERAAGAIPRRGHPAAPSGHQRRRPGADLRGAHHRFGRRADDQLPAPRHRAQRQPHPPQGLRSGVLRPVAVGIHSGAGRAARRRGRRPPLHRSGTDRLRPDRIPCSAPAGPPGPRRARVQATLYYQSIPPGYLQQRFADAQHGSGPQDDIERLYYMTSHLNIAGATSEAGDQVLQGWKLRIAGAASELPS